MQLTVREAAKLLSTSETDIYRWIDDGSLPVYTVNEQYRFNRAELLEWATAKKLKISVQLFGPAAPDSAALPSLARALAAGGVQAAVQGRDKESVLSAVVERLPLGEDVDREFLLQVLLAREALGSTAVGDGIAIPHVRNPIVLHGCPPSVTLSFLAQPVDFGALDGKPVSTLFTVITPTVRAHLHLLARLSGALLDPGFRRVVLERAPAEQILAEAGRVEAAFSGAPARAR
jgi:PTS system nitrogen regulatory IIA component